MVSIISVGWDTGMFSLARVYSEAILTTGNTYTFWGRGVSQGHSDAIRKIDGVKDAKQYTIPIESAIEDVCLGRNPELTTREKHLWDCYVVAEGRTYEEIVIRRISYLGGVFSMEKTPFYIINVL